MRTMQGESLSHDVVHGYIPFISRSAGAGEVAEREIIDHPWVQRLRHIRQLQTAWLVYPSAEHSRFPHVLGVMHLASRAAESLYESLAEVCEGVPSRGYVECLLRMAGLLHDVGHGPYGHFFDDHFLSVYGLTHERLGSKIICEELGELLQGIRRNPHSALAAEETLDPRQVAVLIQRPRGDEEALPQWLRYLRSLFCGIYTVDNMDFVLRDAYMTGYNTQAFDLDRILHYSFFGPEGLTIHERGLSALVRFITVRAELFRSVYFHRTVRAIDLTLKDLFVESRELLFEGNPAERLDAYRELTESSLLVDVGRWPGDSDPRKREAGKGWADFLARRVKWKLACERTRFFSPQETEQSTIFSRDAYFETAVRERLPVGLREMPLRVDVARHVHRPGTRGPSDGQNYLYDSSRDQARALSDSALFRRIPVSFRICRVYTESSEHHDAIATAMDGLFGAEEEDTLTNM